MQKQFVTNLVLSIPFFKESQIDKSVIFYSIKVQKNIDTWTLEKRFSEFDDLNKQLSKLFKNLPEFPAKGLFKPKDPESLKLRQQGLEKFLQKIISKLEWYASDPVKKFLQIDSFSPETSVTPPRLIQELNKFRQGLRDFIVYDNIIFILISEMSVGNRVDQLITNMQMPWEKEAPGVIISMSSLECWARGPEKYERLWSKQFKYQGICLYWSQESETILLGLDSGEIVGLKVPKEFKFYKCEEIFYEKIHDKRVMGITSHNDLIYSVSEDKHLKVRDQTTKQTLFDYTPTNSGIDSLVRQDNRLFLGSSCGKLAIYDISARQCILQTIVQNNSKSRIRGLTVDSSRNYVFGAANNGEVCIYNVQKPGREKYSQISANFKLEKKARSIAWSNQRGEGMLGDDNGILTFINEKTGESIYALKAHDDAITKLFYNQENNILISASKDKSIKFWQPPTEWMDKRVIQDNLVQKEIQKQEVVLKQKNDDSDSDDLDGWHKF